MTQHVIHWPHFKFIVKNLNGALCRQHHPSFPWTTHLPTLLDDCFVPHPLFSNSQHLLSIMNSVPLSLRKQERPERGSHSAHCHISFLAALVFPLLPVAMGEPWGSPVQSQASCLSPFTSPGYHFCNFHLPPHHWFFYLESFPSVHKHATVSLILTPHTSLPFLVKPTKSKPSLPILTWLWAEVRPQCFRRLLLSRSPPRGPISVLRIPDLLVAAVRGDLSCLLGTLSLLDI